jgi:hypothetical protein
MSPKTTCVRYHIAPPSDGTWIVGDIVFNTDPSTNGVFAREVKRDRSAKDRPFDLSLFEQAEFARIVSTDDARDGVAAFVEKRPAQFQGR